MTAKFEVDQRTTVRKITTMMCIALALLMIILGEEMRAAIYEGLIFSITTILPTLFPFFILSDLWVSFFCINHDGWVAKGFEKIFRVNGYAISAFLSGFICGFPVGVKVASQLYAEKKIGKYEFEHLCGFVNNPSAAFVISGVGAGIFKDIRLGIILYMSVLLSSILKGFIFRKKEIVSKKQEENIWQSFNISNSIQNAGLTSLNVCSCIIFFSGLIGLISAIIKSEAMLTSISLFLEVTNAVRTISSARSISRSLKLLLTAFALGFSGFSVHIQAFCFMPKEISKLKYLFIKLTQGSISALFILLWLISSK